MREMNAFEKRADIGGGVFLYNRKSDFQVKDDKKARTKLGAGAKCNPKKSSSGQQQSIIHEIIYPLDDTTRKVV